MARWKTSRPQDSRHRTVDSVRGASHYGPVHVRVQSLCLTDSCKLAIFWTAGPSPRQQVLRNGDEGTHAENCGVLVCQPNEQHVVSQTTTSPLALFVLYSRSHRRAFVLVFRTIIIFVNTTRFFIFQSRKV